MNFDVGGDQDRIDIATIFDNLGVTDTSNVFGTYLQYSDNGSGDTVVEMDLSGSGSNWNLLLVTLNNVDSADLGQNQFMLE